ncbi:hypothetical protein HJFPF1_04564 [Paramyrothecium foliicola]|nr:hypothetical protein HJFPF1_04564 [Paramyrothecium foliicola]
MSNPADARSDSPSPLLGDFDIVHCEGCEAWYADMPSERAEHRDCLARRAAAEAREAEEQRRAEEEARQQEDNNKDDGNEDVKSDVATAA